MNRRGNLSEPTVRPLTADRREDLETLFGTRGCGIARRCWCTYYRRSGPAPPALTGRSRIEASRRPRYGKR